MYKKILPVLLVTFFIAFNASAHTGKPSDAVPVLKIADSSDYTGKYKYEGLPFEYMTVTMKDGQLSYSGGDYSGTLTPIKDKKDAFDANGQALFTFIRNSEGKITDLQIDYQGQTFTGKREDK